MPLRRKGLRKANSSLGMRRSARLHKGRRIHAKEVDRSNKALPKAKSKKCNASVLVGTPFKVECPVLPNSNVVGSKVECPVLPKSNVVGSVFEPEHEDGGFKHLDTTYAVHPIDDWKALETYKNFIIREEKFPVGSIVYINRNPRVPPVPPPGSSEVANLKYDRKNLWVAKVLEIRAKGHEHVYLRVFWLYWPDELPNGRQPYHGEEELVMSNAMDIVDAMTVTGPAEVAYWDERGGDHERLGQRYFRQFLDIKKLGPLGGPKGSELSAIRRHCTCKQFYNPDTKMFQCGEKGCGIWNHEGCLEGLFLQKIEVDQAPKRNLRSTNPRQGILNAKISKANNGYTIKATMTGGGRSGTENWEACVRCLRCEKAIQAIQ